MDGHARSGELLGFPPDARVLLVNCDDLGMYEGVNAAVVESVERGIAGSCSLMPPCPAAPHAMRLLGERPHIPFGIHLTLVCDTAANRWGPLSPKSNVPSLLDDSGGLHEPGAVGELLSKARIEEVEREFRAQITSVADAGLGPTHLDWHCLADGGRDDIFDLTLSLAAEHGLAVRVWLGRGRRKLRPLGFPVTDNDFVDSFRLGTEGKSERYAQLMRELPAGLSEWAVHPGLGDEESRALDPGGWLVRRTDHEFLTSPEARELLRDEGIFVTDYAAVREVWRRAASSP
ncbi:ChbG/HpnK family deacetylase [Streptomyces bathyalis]|uniref:ChbG/HpnK family deacetylase n=1 Tax=Streptomyces bathyalis TaxID=2710756 RepID=A0A7T1TB30_9ACTN|nr:polysaccharide deacetylase family protein [Streptomyces bathyalis]QPP09619.1 ChbG/HpnK family deacetylase [Streptomyces bathyalis]